MGSMLKQMWVALAALFTMVEVFGSAGTKLARAADHLGGWCEDTAGSFADQAREERKAKLAILQSTQVQALENTLGGMPQLTGNGG